MKNLFKTYFPDLPLPNWIQLQLWRRMASYSDFECALARTQRKRSNARRDGVEMGSRDIAKYLTSVLKHRRRAAVGLTGEPRPFQKHIVCLGRD